MHQLYGFGQHARLIGQRDTGVHVQHMGTGLDLRQRVSDDAAVIAGHHFGGHDFAAGGVDALANDDEGAVKANDDLAGRGADDGIGHATSFGIEKTNKK